MNLTDIKFKKGAFLAPMAGVTDRAFRRLCAEFGAIGAVTEMVSCKAIEYKDRKTETLYAVEDLGISQGIQVFGSDVNSMKIAVRDVINGLNHDFLDINMGCPVAKIVNNKEGSALMLDELKAFNIVGGIKSVSKKPVSVKIRLGFTKDRIKASSFAKVLEEAGADFITVHARTRDMFYSGNAMHEEVKKVKDGLSIPLIANGDIFRPEDAAEVLKITGADAIMVGRGALGRPWLFSQIRDYLKTGTYAPDPSIRERVELMLRHFELMNAYKSERTCVLEMRKHAAWYLKGLENMTETKKRLMTCKTKEEFFDAVKPLCLEF